ncbi:MAG TPA: dihydropteroate synthase [Anaeromyxobacteraceae bacterium]|nr:dihydropteroate synthase [Anaeromyxobacteraceae bacterium]
MGARLLEGPGPFIMGVVNATPDSFSDGGRYLALADAVAGAERMAEEGADLIDLGGESTRPGAPAVAVDEELRRIIPVIERLRTRGFRLPISVDTSKGVVARAALAAGADIVNDVRGGEDPHLLAVVAAAGAPCVLMHSRGAAGDTQRAVYRDVVADVVDELRAAILRAEAGGVAPDGIVIDPGLGFSKTAGQNLALLRGLDALRALGKPLLVGPSRKSFIGAVTGAPVGERLAGTLAAVTACVLAGVEIVRVHDVREARQAAQVAAAIRSGDLPAQRE